MADGMGRELTYLSSHTTNRYLIPNWGMETLKARVVHFVIPACKRESCCVFDGILGKYHS